MAKPPRLHTASTHSNPRTFFITTRTAAGRALFRTLRMANLLIEVLRTYMRAGKFQVIDFVIMPDHVHLILRVPADSSVEKCVQLIKGGFSFRARRELGFQGEVWQRGYSEMRIHDEESLKNHHQYIAKNPVKAGLTASANEYPFCFKFLKDRKAAGAKCEVSIGCCPFDREL